MKLFFCSEHGIRKPFVAITLSSWETPFWKNCKFSTLNIFCVETIIVIWLLVASNYSMNPPEYNDIRYYCIMKIWICLNNVQREKDTQNAPIFEDIFQFISKTKNLG